MDVSMDSHGHKSLPNHPEILSVHLGFVSERYGFQSATTTLVRFFDLRKREE